MNEEDGHRVDWAGGARTQRDDASIWGSEQWLQDQGQDVDWEVE